MKLSLIAFMCLLACTVSALEIDVSQSGDFLVLRKEGSGVLSTYAIRMAHISCATLERTDNLYTIVITTSLTQPGKTTPVLMQYRIDVEDRRLMENTFNKILALLANKDS